MKPHLRHSFVFPFHATVLAVVVVLAPTSGRASPAPSNELALLTSIVTAAVAAETSFDVISSADVRRQLELEADKQTTGCSEDSLSCLAEVAGALGARLVVSGQVGRLGETYVLTLNLFDSSDSQAAGRVVLREKSMDKLSGKVGPTATKLVASFVAAHPLVEGGAKTKVLVLDLNGDASAPVKEVVKPNTLLVPGIVVSSTGGVLVLGGGVLLLLSGLAHNTAVSPDIVQKEAAAAYDFRDQMGWGGTAAVAVGVVGAGVGIALIALGGD